MTNSCEDASAKSILFRLMQRRILGGCYPKGDGETSVEVVGGVCFIVFIYGMGGGGGGGGGLT